MNASNPDATQWAKVDMKADRAEPPNHPMTGIAA
jgi:hypothetical protein